VCANLLMDRVIESREGEVSYVRDVGVAGSNPVTPSIDFRGYFLIDSSEICIGSRENIGLGPRLGPTFEQIFLGGALPPLHMSPHA
jgi:hypothetical protein